MDDADLLRAVINSRVAELRAEIDKFQDEMDKKLKEAKENEILLTLSKINRRLDAIEARLPEVEAEEF